MSSFPCFDFVDSSHLCGLSLFSHSVVAQCSSSRSKFFYVFGQTGELCLLGRVLLTNECEA
jgi:hypothetical protein